MPNLPFVSTRSSAQRKLASSPPPTERKAPKRVEPPVPLLRTWLRYSDRKEVRAREQTSRGLEPAAAGPDANRPDDVPVPHRRHARRRPDVTTDVLTTRLTSRRRGRRSLTPAADRVGKRRSCSSLTNSRVETRPPRDTSLVKKTLSDDQ
ncbi:hypothetical protein JYU34_010676 [Plutella xylostella]|uniref:Uncharacterized protein n=1 Tax=Plutella xylostella TaxID=51655 RepID=A0ABQ7QG74_PLUXY|nr:hypothetical protein JYU34_010676 [Plutella xylostella]